MKSKLLYVLLILVCLSACKQVDYLKEDTWIEYQLVRPKIKVTLPQSFRFLTEYPEENTFYSDTTSIFLWPEDPYVAIGFHSQFDDFDAWFKKEKELVLKQERKVFRESRQLGQFKFDLILYTKFNKRKSQPSISYAFVTIDGTLYDIHNQLDNDQYFIKFLESIKKS